MFLDINAPQTLGGGNQSRPYAPMGRFLDLISFESGLKTRYHSLQVGINRPFTKGLLIKGAYTLSQGREHGGRRWGRRVVQFAQRVPPQHGAGGLRPDAQLPRRPWSINCPWQSNGGHDNVVPRHRQRLAAQRNVRRLLRHAVHRDRERRDREHAGQQQTADLVGTPHKSAKSARQGRTTTPAAWAQPQGVRFGNTGRNQFRGPGAVNLDMSLFRAFPMGGDASPRVPRRSVEPDEYPQVRQPDERCQQRQLHAHSGTFGTATSGAYFERNIRLGLRFSF